ncbi:MAG: response regulator transcription factor [Octadecabacter sp.]|nr:response regulator transcription factor [Octadecabacter sp.]
MRIVVVEDNISVAKGICYHLQDAGHAVDMLHDGADADAFLRGDGADMIVLDINLPGKDGLCILRGLRARGDQRPVLMLTARAETNDKVAGLDAGADDYLGKPFEMQEFSARIRALTRRVTETPTASRTIGPLRFDLTARMIEGPDGKLDIPRREVALFERLLMAEGRLVTKQVLLDSLYGTGADVGDPVVEVYVSRLRKRLQPYGVHINVKRGMGYFIQTDPV